MTLSIPILNDIKLNASCTESSNYLNVMLTVIMLSVIMLSVVILNVVMLSVVAPEQMGF